MFASNIGTYEGVIDGGIRLAETSVKEGGWAEFFAESMDITDTYLRGSTAIMLENAKRRLMRGHAGPDANGMMTLNEATRSAVMTGFNKHLFPIIRAGFPNNAALELFSMQPTTRKSAQITYWDYIVGRGKGTYVPGQKIFDAQSGHRDIGVDFSNDKVNEEIIGAGDGVEKVFAATLKFADGGGVRPGTLAITATVGASPVVVTDDANGGLVGMVGTINYRTGALAITYTTEPDDATAISASYRWDSEGSNLLPQIDIQITTTSVDTERRAMEINYSEEAMFDVIQEMGVNLESDFVAATSANMNAETSNQLTLEAWAAAQVVATFDVTPPGGYATVEHYQDFNITLNAASNRIHALTQKGHGNWIVVDELGSNLIESLRNFKAVTAPKTAQGLHRIGTLGKFAVYKNIHIARFPDASANGNVLMGFKGQQFYEAGLIWAPYQLLYTTPTLTRSNFVSSKGIASRYAIKMVNPDFYVRINLAATTP